MAGQISLNVDPSGDFDADFPLTPQKIATMVDPPKDPAALKEIGGLEGIAKSFHADLHRGLSNTGADPLNDKRVALYGRNVLPPPPRDSFFEIVWGALQDKVLIILICAALISIILGSIPATSEHPKTGWFDGVAILAAVAIVVLVTSTNDFQKQKQFEKLDQKKKDRLVNAIRDGEQQQISVFDVKVGDVLLVETGDLICADGIYIEGHGITADESALTGETDPVKKGHVENGLDPFFISGSQILEGTGKMLAIAVGEQSFNGRMMLALQVPDEDTPLQIQLEKLATTIGYFGLAAAGLLLLIGIPKYFIIASVNKELQAPDFKKAAGQDMVKLVIQAITIVVVAVPEGLPLAVTIALAYGMIKMLADNNLVRHLAACETMGGATNICSDKTGTLTQNVMTVVTGWFAGRKFGEITDRMRNELPPDFLELMSTGIAVNSNAFESFDENKKATMVGSKTEVAMLLFSRILGYEFQTIRDNNKPTALFPFSSAKKRMSAVIRANNGRQRMFTKGASEIVLEMCDRVMIVPEGSHHPEIRDITPELRAYLNQVIHEFAKDALRTICMAYEDLQTDLPPEEEPSVRMILVGIVGIRDPLRPEVPDAVAQCQHAGITVRMVTGDNITTAENIARSCGILQPGGLCMEGPKFRALPEAEMDRIIPRLQVLARSSPTDKQILVGRLKALGEVVAVTGDGTNDGPALKMADVGFSMGIAGTEVAKAASAIVLLDDNFASIVKAVMWGRNIYDAIKKFIQFQLCVNVVAVTIAFIGTLSDARAESPLTAVQLLWVNLIMDSLAALALATEVPDASLLERKPVGRKTGLITRTMWRFIAGHSAFQLAVMFILLYAGPALWKNKDTHFEKASRYHYTVIFNTFVFMQVFNEINARILGNALNPFKGIFKNKFFLSILVITIGVQILFVEVGGDFTSTARLHWSDWMICVLIGFVELPWGFVLRLIPIKDKEIKTKVIDMSDLESVEMQPTHLEGSSELLMSGYPSTAQHVARPRSELVHRTRWNLVRQAVRQLGVISALQKMRQNAPAALKF